jgi:hypothetical protein
VEALLASLSEDEGEGGAAKRICNKMWEPTRYPPIHTSVNLVSPAIV